MKVATKNNTNQQKIAEPQKLQLPWLVLFLVLLICALSIFFAYQYSENQKAALQMQESALTAARQRYQSAGLEKETIIKYLPQYQALLDKGFIGQERRIEWVEALRAQHKAHKLFDVKYSISQQEVYRPKFLLNLGGFTLNRSIMKLDLDMLHEGDILQLVESMAANNTAPFILRDCEMIRINPNTELMNKQLMANLHAQCELDWLTLHEPATVLQGGVVP